MLLHVNKEFRIRQICGSTCYLNLNNPMKIENFINDLLFILFMEKTQNITC